MPLDDNLPPLNVAPEEPAPVSALKQISERFQAAGLPFLSYEQTGIILPFLERLYDVESLLREAKLHLNPASPLAGRVADYFARVES